MPTGDVSVMGPNDSNHSVDVAGLPEGALRAIIDKLNQKSQRSRKSFNHEYNISTDDLKRILKQIKEEFHNYTKISISAQVSILLGNNQRFEFASWEEFEDFDKTLPHRTRSLTIEMVIDVLRTPDGTFERYQVQIEISNRHGMHFIGTVSIRSGDVADIDFDFGSLKYSVDYNNYTQGKNIIGALESWEKTLIRRSANLRLLLQRKSSAIRKLITFFIICSGIFATNGVIIIIQKLSSNYNFNHTWIVWAALVVYTSSQIGFLVGSLVERQIDKQQPSNNLTITQGDKKFDIEVGDKNRALTRRAIIYAIAALFHTTLGLLLEKILVWTL